MVPPKAVKLFPMKSERSSSGLLEFENTMEAVAAVMACNHAAIESPGMYIFCVYIMRKKYVNSETVFSTYLLFYFCTYQSHYIYKKLC